MIQTLKTITGAELGRQVRVGSEPKAEMVLPLVNREGMINKPVGGVWTSSMNDVGLSGWIEWCYREAFRTTGGQQPMWALEPKADAVLLVVETMEDTEALAAVYGYTNKYDEVQFDFERMAEDYDGLTLRTPYGVGEPFYGWDCESTIFFRWAFEQVVQG